MTDRLQLPSGFSEGEVVLRSPTVADVERITEICQDSDIQRFTRVPVPYTRDDAQGFVDTATEAPQNGRGAQLLVEADGTVTGCVGLGIDWTDRLGIIGYWTAPEAPSIGSRVSPKTSADVVIADFLSWATVFFISATFSGILKARLCSSEGSSPRWKRNSAYRPKRWATFSL